MKLVFLIIALVLFILASLGATIIPHILEWGFVFFAASFLPVPNE